MNSQTALADLIAGLATPTPPAPPPCLDPFCIGQPGGGCGRTPNEHLEHHGAQAVRKALGSTGGRSILAPTPPTTTPNCYKCELGDPHTVHQTADQVFGIDAHLDQSAPPAGPPPRCPVTELVISQCAHCRPVPPKSEASLGPWFGASYAGTCSSCGSRFSEGDRIRSDADGGWLATCCGNVNDKNTAAPTPAAPAGPPPSTVAEMRDVLTHLDASRPRSRQTRLGPSELGTPCQRQIGMKLAGVTRQPEDKRPPWAPMQGTAMHVLMEEALRFHNQQLGRQRWIIEEKLVIDPGLPDVDPITGHGDAYDTDHGMVVDWKYVGVTALREVKRKTIPNDQLVKPDYRVQAHLYGRGHERGGRDVRYVRLVFLARSHDYADSAEWTEPYRPEIAEWAVDRYYATHDLLGALDVAANPALWAAVPAVPGKACDWCPFRRPGGAADGTGCPGNTDQKIDKQLRGLIA